MKKADKIWINLMEFGGRMGCHQMENRSFYFKGYQFPVCARCTGVLVGELIALAMIVFGTKLNAVLLFFMLFVMGIDWFIQYINILESTNLRRLITGILGGIGLTYLYWYVFVFIVRLLIQ